MPTQLAEYGIVGAVVGALLVLVFAFMRAIKEKDAKFIESNDKRHAELLLFIDRHREKTGEQYEKLSLSTGQQLERMTAAIQEALKDLSKSERAAAEAYQDQATVHRILLKMLTLKTPITDDQIDRITAEIRAGRRPQYP
jgi:hypothetical protein